MDWALPLGTAVLTLYVVLTELRLWRLGRENDRLRRRLRDAGLAVGLVLGTGGPAAAFPKLTPAHAYNRTPTHPDRAVIEALIFLETKVPPAEWCFWRFFHFLATADEDLADDVGDWQAYLQQANGTAPGPVRPIPIDKAGRVYAVDRREAGWSAAAFHAVAALDNTCREPNVDPLLADELRRAIGVEREKDAKYAHCEGLVPAPWFVREVQETNRHKGDPENIAYYNLLYSRERFGDDFEPVGLVGKADGATQPAPGTGRPRQGKTAAGHFLPYDAVVDADRLTVVDAGRKAVVTLERGDGFRVTNATDDPAWVYGTTASGRNGYARENLLKFAKEVESTAPAAGRKGTGFIDRNFPRDADEFDLRWGVKAARDFLARQKVFKANGTIIAGAFNDPRSGSLVADNDRVNAFFNAPLGLAMKTADFTLTVGNGDLVNNPLGVALDDLAEDASERIYQKQDRWPVWWLNGAKKAGAKRVEFGDPDVVHDRINGGKVTVQTLHKCVGCHYPSDVVLSPSNEKFVAGLKRQQEAFTFGRYGKAGQLVIGQFFLGDDPLAGGWQWEVKHWRETFARPLAAATRTPADPGGWTGARYAAVSNARRDWYDAPVRLGQAAAELGYSRLAVMTACLVLSDFEAGALFLDAEPGVPRAKWDADLFPRLAYVLAFARDAEIGDVAVPGFTGVFPEYARDPRTPPYRMKTLPGGSQ